MKTYCKGESCDAALSEASTHKEGFHQGLKSMGVPGDVVSRVEVRRDKMHRMNSVFTHVWEGKTAECIRAGIPYVQSLCDWHKGVIAFMANELNNKLRGDQCELALCIC